MRLLALASGVVLFVLAGPGATPPPGSPSTASAATLPADFVETTVFSGLTNPTVVRFASDGRVFVAEKSGLVKVFDSLLDSTPSVFADLRTNVHNFWDRGLLGMALHPQFPTTPYVYVLYTYDHVLGDPAPPPKWGSPGVSSDGCPNPPGATGDGCVVSARLSRLEAAGSVMTGAEQVLIEDWCQQYPSHSVGTVEFGPDGSLYASAGDGASFNFVDYGQDGNPLNPCGDPPGGVGATLTPPSAEGGALRSQDLRTPSDPATLDGSIIRVDPTTGAARPDNPLAGSGDANARRIVAYGLRNPFRFTFRPGTSELWLGDVGWNEWEEINRILSPTDSTVENFGWPCYEGQNRQGGYDATDLAICEALYVANEDAKPFFAYHHSNRVVSGETCPTGSSSIAGLAFEFAPAQSSFPADYQRALFFADYSRDCIWVMKKDAGGVPAPGLVETFAAGAANPVNLEFGPDGNLYYVDFDGGTIRRIAPAPAPGSCPAGQYEASYYGNTALSGSPILTRCESTIDYDWGDGSPAPGVPADDFSVRWQGTFDFPAGETTFTATADDGIRVWVDGILVIDAWVDQPPTTYTATRTLSAGAHQVRVEYYERGWGAVARLGWGQGGGGGPCAASEYEATYYPNISLAGSPVLTRCEPAVDHSWGTGSPAPVVPVDNFSARWVGSFDFAAGETTFSATADDGIRVFVDDVIVIDAWVDQSPTTYMATRTLSAGTHAVRVEYYERGGGAVAQLSWTTASSAPTIVSRTPAPGATGVGLNVSPSATFSEAMDAGTITATTFTLSRQADSSPVAATVSYDPTTHTATLDPSSDLQPGTGYQATVEGGAGGVTDSSGTPLGADSTWTFTTASAPNQPPAAQISAPTAALTWKVGDAIMFSGQAVDPEQGALPASALSWRLLMQHCPSNCHSHTLQTWAGVASGSFSAPDHEYPSYLELELTATDAQGATDVETVRLDPQTVIISFSTSPSGLELAVNASSQTTPFTRTVISGSTNSVSAPSPQTLAGTTYEFSSWSDGGGQTHNVTAPAGGATYTATYVIAPPRNTTLPVISGQPRVGSTLTVSNGAWTGSQPMSFSYQWLRCSNNALASCTPISGQTASSYVLIAADRRQRIRARVTATNAGGSGQATSSATPPVK